MSTPKLIAQPGMTPEQERALALARARRRRAEVEGQAQPAQPQPAPQAPGGLPTVDNASRAMTGSQRPEDQFALAEKRLNDRTERVSQRSAFSDVQAPSSPANRPQPQQVDPQLEDARKRAIIGQQTQLGGPSRLRESTVTSLLESGDPAVQRLTSTPYRDGQNFMTDDAFGQLTPDRQQAELQRMTGLAATDAQRRADENTVQQRAQGKIPLDTGSGQTWTTNPSQAVESAAIAQRLERQTQERREASRTNMGDMLLTHDDQGRLQPGTDTDRDIGKGIISLPARAVNAASNTAQSVVNLVGDAYQSVRGGERIIPRVDMPEIPIPQELESLTGQLGQGVLQFLIGRGVIGKIAPGGGYAAHSGKDAATLFAAFDSDTQRMSETLAADFMRENGLGFMAARDPNNPIGERLKNAFEELLIAYLPVEVARLTPKAVDAVTGVGRAAPTPTNAGGAFRTPPPQPQSPGRTTYNAMPETERRAMVQAMQDAGMSADDITAQIRAGNIDQWRPAPGGPAQPQPTPAATQGAAQAQPQPKFFDAKGDPLDVEIVAQSENGGYIVRTKDGREVIVGAGDVLPQSARSPDYVPETMDFGGRKISDLSDQELAVLKQRSDETIKVMKAEGQEQSIPSILAERNAAVFEQKRRASGAAQAGPQPSVAPVAPPPPRPAPPGMAVPPQAAAQTPVPPTSSAQVELPTLTRAEQRAADILLKRLEADGVTWDDVKRAAAAMGRRNDSGVYETIGELVAYVEGSSGANMRGLQMAGGVIPGPTQERILARVAENDAKLGGRATRAATRATGQKAENAVDTLQALDQRLRTESGPRYEAFHSAPVDPRVFANEVLPILNTEAGQTAAQQALSAIKGKEARLKARVASGKASAGQQREYAHVQQAARSLEDYLADPVRGTAVPTPYALDRIKRAFDNQIEAAGQQSEIARDLRGTKTDFADGVSNATGGTYGEALGFYEGNKRLQDAFAFGNGALSKKTWQLQREMESGLKGRAWSGGEIEAIAMGVARQIEDMIEANDQRALTMLIKGKALENLATALGNPKAAKTFEQSMRRIAANREWGRRVGKGSDTAMRQASVDELATEADDAILRNLDQVDRSKNAPTPFGLAWDLLVSPVIKGAKDAYFNRRYAGLKNPEVNKILAPILGDAATPETLKAADRIISARLAEKNQTRGPVQIGYGTPPKPKPAAPSAKAAPKPKPAPKTRKKPPPGTTSQSPAFVGGAAATGIPAGLATYAATGDEELAMGVGIGAGIGGGFLGNRIAKAVSGPKGAPKVRAPAGGKAAKPTETPPAPKDWGPDTTKSFETADGRTFRVDFQKDIPGGGVNVSFREAGQGSYYDPTGGNSLASASAILRQVNEAVLDDIAKYNRPVYVFSGETKAHRNLNAQRARTKKPPAGYRWEGPDKVGNVSLVREASSPPTAKPPPVSNGNAKTSSGAQRQGNLGKPIDLETTTEQPTNYYFGQPDFPYYASSGSKEAEVLRRVRDKEWTKAEVPLESITGGGQATIHPDFRNVPQGDGFRNGPVVLVRERGQLILHDGNHRAVAAAERGDKTIQAVIVDLDASRPPVSNGVGGSKPLPMDEGSRMQRAREMGFDVDTPLYHGTASDVQAFDPAKRGGVTNARSAKLGTWLTGSPKTAKGYADLASEKAVADLIKKSEAAERAGQWDKANAYIVQAEKLEASGGAGGQNTMPLYVRGKMKTVDMDGAKYDPDDHDLAGMVREAKAEGFDGVRFENFSDEAGWGNYEPTTNVVVFDPKNIRGKFAKFDPSQEGSSKLLAGMGGKVSPDLAAGGAAGLLASMQPATDANGDGVIDEFERGAPGASGVMSALSTGFLVNRGRRMLGNKLKGGPKPPPAARQMGMGGAQPLRKIDPEDTPNRAPAPPEIPKPKGQTVGFKGGGGGFSSGPTDDFPEGIRYLLGGLGGTVAGGTVGGIAGMGDLDGDGVAGTVNDQRIGIGAGIGVGAGGGLTVAHLMRLNKAASLAKASGRVVEEHAEAVIRYNGFPDAITAQKAVVSNLRQGNASADRIAMAERVLAAIQRRKSRSDDILDGKKIESNVTALPTTNKPKPPPVSMGFTGGKGTKPPPPPPGAPGKSTPIKNAAGRAVVGGTLGTMLAGDAEGQDDLTGKISETEQSIADLKKLLADFDKAAPKEKQRILKEAGFYAGDIDGDFRGKTTEGIERWTAKQEAALSKAEDALTGLVRRDAYQRNNPSPVMQGLREYGPIVALAAALYGTKLFRGSAAKKSVAQAAAKSAQLNRLITKGPVTGMINKADQSRPANLNTLWQEGGATKDQLPFRQDSKGKWQPNPNAKPAEELFAEDTAWQTITRYIKGKDLTIIMASGFESVAVQPFIDKAESDLREAEQEWKDNPSDETFKRVEDAKNALLAYQTAQRIGWGVAGGRVLGSIGAGYAKPRPNIPLAATEQAGIKQYIAANKPPPKPRSPRPPGRPSP